MHERPHSQLLSTEDSPSASRRYQPRWGAGAGGGVLRRSRPVSAVEQAFLLLGRWSSPSAKRSLREIASASR